MPRKHLKEELRNETAADICVSIQLFLLFYNNKVLETRSFFCIWDKVCGKPKLISQGPDGVWV